VEVLTENERDSTDTELNVSFTPLQSRVARSFGQKFTKTVKKSEDYLTFMHSLTKIQI